MTSGISTKDVEISARSNTNKSLNKSNYSTTP